MIRLEQVLIVEGKYDKNKLKQIFDAAVIEMGGFGIFNDGEKLELIRTLAETKGIIVLTDSDGAGLVIRNYIKGSVFKGKVFHAYIPDIVGKEKRKTKASKAGTLGVEGVPDSVIVEAVKNSGALCTDVQAKILKEITKTDLYFMGLCGKQGSSELRQKVIEQLKLPKNLSSNSFLEVVNIVLTLDELDALMAQI